jgi:isochorismate pyruvate lyase
MIKKAEDCQTMAEVRAGVDDVDARLIALLGQRFAYMESAARIKTEASQVRNEERKAEVIRNAKANARTHNVPEPLVAAMWEMLVESSISFEAALFKARQKSG